jgi:hypothetical protein
LALYETEKSKKKGKKGPEEEFDSSKVFYFNLKYFLILYY